MSKPPKDDIPVVDMDIWAVKRELPAQLPFLNSLDRVANEFGSKSQFLEACTISTVPGVQTFVRICREEPKLSLEEGCARAGLSPDRLLGLVVPSLYLWNAAVGKLLNAINLPATMKASIDTAKEAGPEGFPDRRVQFQIAGLLNKDGTNITTNINIGTEVDSFESIAAINVTPTNVQSEDK